MKISVRELNLVISSFYYGIFASRALKKERVWGGISLLCTWLSFVLSLKLYECHTRRRFLFSSCTCGLFWCIFFSFLIILSPFLLILHCYILECSFFLSQIYKTVLFLSISVLRLMFSLTHPTSQDYNYILNKLNSKSRLTIFVCKNANMATPSFGSGSQ